MTWAYSPSYSNPFRAPGVIGLAGPLWHGTLAHPEGYEIMPQVERLQEKCARSGSFTNKFHGEAFRDADIIYPKSWAPFAAMEKRTNYMKTEILAE